MGEETREIRLDGAAETAALGAALAARLYAGDVVLLSGGLGAGKTTLARGVIAALAGEEDAPSPTFTLVQTYETTDGGLLLHADLYRIDDESELAELGLEDAFEDAITLVEWPDRLGALTPPERLEIAIEPCNGGRIARLKGVGERWRDRLAGL